MPQRTTARGALELARLGVEALNRRDFDALMRLYGPSSVWDGSLWGMGVYEGPAAIRDFIEEWLRSYDELEIEVEELRDFGNEVALTVVCQSARQLGSDRSALLREAYVAVSADGAFVNVTSYPDIDDARAAAERASQSRA